MLFQNERIVTVYYFISAIKGYHFWTIRRLHSVVMSSLNLKSASKKVFLHKNNCVYGNM